MNGWCQVFPLICLTRWFASLSPKADLGDQDSEWQEGLFERELITSLTPIYVKNFQHFLGVNKAVPAHYMSRTAEMCCAAVEPPALFGRPKLRGEHRKSSANTRCLCEPGQYRVALCDDSHIRIEQGSARPASILIVPYCAISSRR
jgi:hypothetical protein